MSINEKLAVDVMGALKGFKSEFTRCEEQSNFTYVSANPTYAFPGGKVILQDEWNPTADLNQLKMCYEALSDDENAMNLFYCHFQDIYSGTFGAYPSSMTFFSAIFKHPELVAQSILKARGVS